MSIKLWPIAKLDGYVERDDVPILRGFALDPLVLDLLDRNDLDVAWHYQPKVAHRWR